MVQASGQLSCKSSCKLCKLVLLITRMFNIEHQMSYNDNFKSPLQLFFACSQICDYTNENPIESYSCMVFVLQIV